MNKKYYCRQFNSRKRLWLFTFLVIAGCMQVVKAQSKKVTHNQYHVSAAGNDSNNGSLAKPFKTVSAAANMAMAGDTITVHAGVYREEVSPPRGGLSDKERIWYQAAPGEKVVLKGSEIIKGWQKLDNSVWKVEIPNNFFGRFNPYIDTIHGDWLEKGRWSHTGEVYLNEKPLTETNNLRKLDSAHINEPLWYCKVDEKNTTIWANFYAIDPNDQLVEINVRQAVFYPSKPGINYIGVKGFTMSQAATPWAPPTAEQIGLLGTHWSKGWIIEDNDISYSKCAGITLGKYGDEWDNRSESVEGFIKTTERAYKNSWDKEHVGSHLVIGNHISNCGQVGIAGSLGVIFSTITGNTINSIGKQQLFWGYEMAGIKLHAAVDVVISKNHIYDTEGGIWLDWMAQGIRVTGNLLHDNRVQDLSLEVDHGPVIIDNNLFLSPELAQVRLSQGVAFVHNIIAWDLWPTDTVDNRKTPFLKPHSTEIAGFHNNPCGDTRFYNNVFTNRTNLSPYNQSTLPVQMKGNVYLMKSTPSRYEQHPIVKPDYDPQIRLEEKQGGWYLSINLQNTWGTNNRPAPVTSQQLGIAIVPQQPFTDRNDKAIAFGTDFKGAKRNQKYPVAGAFEVKKDGAQHIKVW